MANSTRICASMLSTLPPTKGMSLYTLGLIKGVVPEVEVDFLGFNKLYPNFLYPGGTEDKTQTQPEIKGLTIRNIISFYNPFSWIRAGFSIKGKVLHAQWWSYALAPTYLTVLFIAKYFRKKRIIITIHNVKPHEDNFIINLLNGLVFFLGEHFIVHTEAMKQSLINGFHIKPERVTIVPMGIFPTSEDGLSSGEARNLLRIPSDSKVLLFFGNIKEYKGLDVLLKALEIIIDKYGERKFLLIIAGQLWVNWAPYAQIIEKHALNQYIKKHTSFIPEENLGRFFKASDLVVLPYKKFDAQSAVAALAFNYRKPMIVSTAGGLNEFTCDKDYVFSKNDSDELASKIIHVFRNRDFVADAESVYRNLIEKHSWKSIGEQTVALYRKYSENAAGE